VVGTGVSPLQPLLFRFVIHAYLVVLSNIFGLLIEAWDLLWVDPKCLGAGKLSPNACSIVGLLDASRQVGKPFEVEVIISPVYGTYDATCLAMC